MSNIEERRVQRRNMMLTGNLYKVIPYVAFPMIISMLIDSFYNLADTYFVSQLGTSATAAVGVNDSLLHLLRALAMGFGMGASSIISKLLGEKKENEAGKVATTAIYTAAITLSLIAAVAYILKEPMVMLLGSTEGAKPYAISYASFILISAPFTGVEVTLSHTLRAEGSTNYSMIGMTSGCVVNCLLDPLFINYFKMGVGGAALATTISKAISAFVLMIPFLRGKTIIEIKPSLFTPKWYIYKDIIRMGVPAFLRASMMSIASIVTNNVASGFGDIALASVSISNKVTRLMGSAILGFGQGFQPVAGYCYGAKMYKRVRDAFIVCTKIGAVVSVFVATILAIFAPNVVSVFAKSGDVETIRLSALIIRTQCVTLFPHAWIMIINGLNQALGRPVESTVVALSRQVLCLIPCVIILTKIFGLNGLAFSQATADILSLFISVPIVIGELNMLKRMEKEQATANNSL